MSESKDKKSKMLREYLKFKIKFMKGIIITCITFIILYTIAQLVLSCMLQMELSPTLTTCVYAFFGTELAACAFIKIFEKPSKEENSNKDTSGNIIINQDNSSDG